MEKIQQLISNCKCGISIEINPHRNRYESVEDYLDGFAIDDEDYPKAVVLKKMIELDSIVVIQFYPSTPIGSYIIYHYDLDIAIDVALFLIPE